MQLLKGLISTVSGHTAEVILPERNNQVTAALPILRYNRYCIDSYGVECAVQERYIPGQFVVVAVFSDDLNDGVILT